MLSQGFFVSQRFCAILQDIWRVGKGADYDKILPFYGKQLCDDWVHKY